MRQMRYEKRLAKSGINRIEDRRVRGYLIEMYKFINGLIKKGIRWLISLKLES